MRPALHAFVLSLILFCSSSISAQSWEWAVAIGNSEAWNGAYVTALAPFKEDGVVMAGSFNASTLQVGTEELTGIGSQDILVAARDREGNHLWATRFGGALEDETDAVATDVAGNVYVAGRFSSLSFVAGNDTLWNKGLYDGFLVKLDAEGNVVWAISISTEFNDDIYALTLDATGNIFLCGRSYNPSVNPAQTSIFIMKVGANKEILWFKVGSSADSNLEFSGLTLDAQGNCIAGGITYGNVVFEGTHVIASAADRPNGFLVKYSSAGQFVKGVSDTKLAWIQAILSNGDDIIAGGVAVDTATGAAARGIMAYDGQLTPRWSKPAFTNFSEDFYETSAAISITENGDIFLCGTLYSDSLMWANDTITNPPFENSRYSMGYLLKCSAEGQPLWAMPIGGPMLDMATALTALPGNRIVVGGRFHSEVLQFGAIELEHPAELKVFSTHGMTFYFRNDFIFLAQYNNTTTTSTRPNFSISEIVLYPNPSQDHFFLRSEAFSEKPVQVQLFSTDGKLLSQQNILPLGNSLRVETSALPAGLYIVNVISNGQLSAQRFVKY
jgi:hypothetical protein